MREVPSVLASASSQWPNHHFHRLLNPKRLETLNVQCVLYEKHICRCLIRWLAETLHNCINKVDCAPGEKNNILGEITFHNMQF